MEGRVAAQIRVAGGVAVSVRIELVIEKAVGVANFLPYSMMAE